MNNFSDIIYLDPNQIQVSRENRQRKEIDTSDIIDSIRVNGIINPIIIKDMTPNSTGFGIKAILVAGERRLEACKQLRHSAIPCRFFSSLSPLEAQIIEFEENHKRKNLPWRDEVNAIGTIYDLSKSQTPPLTNPQISLSLSIDEQKLNQIIHIYKHINEKILTYAESLNQAINLLHRFKSEKIAKLETNLKKILDTKPLPDYLKPKAPEPLKLNFDTQDIGPLAGPLAENGTGLANNAKIAPVLDPIFNLDFQTWIKDYEGPRFNFIHCDFPQSPENFDKIFLSFMGNLDKILDYQAHILFWLDMKYYERVKYNLTSLELENGLELISEPLIWFKSDTKPNQIFGDPPKSTYEAALIINHNSRPFKKQIQNAFHTPRASFPICPNQKSLPMLKYFLSTFIDSETNVLDPTCGSGSSLLAAEELGAKSILGLEINQERSQKANEKIFRTREIRKILEK